MSKEKYAGLKVFVTAVSCIPRLIPSAFHPLQLCDTLCRCSIHQHKELRDAAWESMLQIMDYRPKMTSLLVQTFAELLASIDDFKTNLVEMTLSRVCTCILYLYIVIGIVTQMD